MGRVMFDKSGGLLMTKQLRREPVSWAWNLQLPLLMPWRCFRVIFCDHIEESSEIETINQA